MIESVQSILVFCALAVASFGIGRPIVRKLVAGPDDGLSVGVWSTVVGLIAAGNAWLFGAWMGLAGLPWAATLLLLGIVWAAVELACVALGRSAPRFLPIEPASSLPRRNAWPPAAHSLVLLAALALVASFVAALAPPTHIQSLEESFEIPKSLLLGQELHLPLASKLTIVHAWFAWAMALDGPVAANLLHWGIGLLAALAGLLLARRLFGSATAWAAWALFVLCPGVQHQMCRVPLDDLALSLLATLSCLALADATGNGHKTGWAVLAGTILGTAVGICAPAGAAGAALAWCIARRRTDWTAVGDVVAASLVAALPWLLVAWPRHAIWPPQSPESALVHLGPLVWLVGAWAIDIAQRSRPRRASPIAGTMAVVLLPLSGRWWCLVAMPCCLAAAHGLTVAGSLPLWPRRAAVAGTVALALAIAAISLQSAGQVLAVAGSAAARQQYLRDNEPAYPAAALVNRLSGPDDRVLCQGVSTLYFDCPAERAAPNGPAASDSTACSLKELVRQAMARGCTYLLTDQAVEPAGALPLPRDAGDRHVGNLDPSWSNCEVTPILRYRFADDKGRPIRYSLWRIRQIR